MIFIRDINANLKSVFQDYLGLYFFGSRSRGDSREHSDYDMVFVFRKKPDWKKKEDIRNIVYSREVEYGMVVDGKYYSQEEVENCRTPFLESVCKEGKFYAV